MKLSKRILSLLCAVVIVVSVPAVGASAAPVASAAVNTSVCACVGDGCDVCYAKAETAVKAANVSIYLIVKVASLVRKPNIECVIALTEGIAAVAIRTAEYYGFEAVCEYTEYIIGGQSVLIDPIKIIKR